MSYIIPGAIEKVFSSDGLLSQEIQNYELRHEQQEMSTSVLQAYKKNRILLVEAATGVGKSFAYLVPALLWAADQKGPTVISTHTIALQEQLLHKDIPFLMKTLGVDLQATLVKGMHNYFCFRRYEEALAEETLFSEEEKKHFHPLKLFAEKAVEGSISELSSPTSREAWEKVCADRSLCTHVECPHFKDCFFFRARKKVADAHIIVVNHAFLVAEMALRLRPDFDESKSLLPKSSKVVLDEAHHLEGIALEAFSRKVDHIDLIRYLGRIYSEHHPLRSRIGLIKTDLQLHRVSFPPIVASILDIEIPAQKKALSTTLDSLFSRIEDFCLKELPLESGSSPHEKRWRLSAAIFSHPLWSETILDLCNLVLEESKKLFALLDTLKKELSESISEKKQEIFDFHIKFVETWKEVFSDKLKVLSLCIASPLEQKQVRWIEHSFRKYKNITLVHADLNVAEYLQKYLFSPKETVVLCSATLTANKNFAFLRQQMGLQDSPFAEKVEEKIYPSPFDFEKNARLYIASDIALPQEPRFIDEASSAIRKILAASQGGCFILFTSYDMLEKCYNRVTTPNSSSLLYLKQGEESKKNILEKFRRNMHSVLFATSSFWEGVDIAGEALRCVVIPKLPFKVPSDPLFQAMSDLYTKEGKDPFLNYSLPLASLQFKQGFGRLIRTQVDRGCVICLDKRLSTKPYGRMFIQDLPPCPVLYKKQEDIIKELTLFYETKGRLP